MFSRTGKYTNEKFFILRKKNEIFTGKTEKVQPRVLFQASNKIKGFLENLEEQKAKKKMLEIGSEDHFSKGIKGPAKAGQLNTFHGTSDRDRPVSAQPEPFKVMLGRFDLENRRKARLKKFKDVPPPGMYNPKPVNKHISTKRYFRPQSSSLHRPYSAGNFTTTFTHNHNTKTRDPLTSSDLSFDPCLPPPKIQGYVDMSLKTHRKSERGGEEEEGGRREADRFTVRKESTVSSNYR